jgi:hypothetical protein
MPIHPSDDIRCPTCGARQAWADTCRRCKCDLRLLRSAVAAYDRHRRICLQLLHVGDPELALHHAQRCHRLAPDGESNRLMSVCHLLRGDWAAALRSAGSDSESNGQPIRR